VLLVLATCPYAWGVSVKLFQMVRACLVRVFVFCFGFVTFYFIEVGTLILI
jgi:hypothetical protein